MQANKKNPATIRTDEHVLAADIRAYEKLRRKLEREHFDEFALFFQGKFIEAFPDFDSAARKAIALFGRGPYLIHQIGSPIGLDTDTAIHLHHR